MGLKNVIGKKTIRKNSNQRIKFYGIPSIWKFPSEIDVIRDKFVVKKGFNSQIVRYFERRSII